MRCPLVDQTAVGAPHGVMKRVRWSRPDPINVVRTRGRFRARRSPGPYPPPTSRARVPIRDRALPTERSVSRSEYGALVPESPRRPVCHIPPCLLCIEYRLPPRRRRQQPGPWRSAASRLVSSRFEKDRTQAAFPPPPVSWRIAVRKSCCSVVSRALVERCGGSSPSP